MKKYKICQRCVMDTSDHQIEFNEQDFCNHCETFLEEIKTIVPKGIERESQLSDLLNAIKKSGKNKKYDCLIGVSGGVDSSYVAYIVKELGLRPLAVHMDNGWNSELAVMNIQNIVDTLGLDLITYVIDWDDFRELQLAYLKASVIDIEVLTDHAIYGAMFQVAIDQQITTIVSGVNVATEQVLPYA